jgi:arylformamidase
VNHFFPGVFDAVSGALDGEDVEKILGAAREYGDGYARRILLRGDGVVTESAARAFAEAGVWLVGTGSQSVGPMDAPMAVHKILLEKEVVLLEGLSLEGVTDGAYFLCAQPLCLSGSDGAPCRAILIDFEGETPLGGK